MKRILILLLVLTLALTAFASCEYIPSEVMDKISPILDKVGIDTGKTEEPTPDVTPVTPAADADLKAAYDYIHQMTKDIAKVTGANYTVFTSAKVGEKTYQVKWEVSVESITITPNEDGVTATVNVPSSTNVDIPYTLKYTVTNEKGESLSRSYEHVVPKFEVNTHAEYLAAESGTNLVVEGIVVAINSKSAGNTRNHLFLADANVTGGYYIYQIDVADPVADLGIQVGMTVRVTGPASPYNGMQEIKGGVPEIIDTTIKTVNPVDITDLFASGADIMAYVGLPVTIKGVTIGDQELGGSSDYLRFSLNGKGSYIRSYKTDFPTTLPASAKEVIEAAHAAHYNWTADVTGILIFYGNTPYLIPMTEDCFTYLQAQEMTDAEKVATELAKLSFGGKYVENTTLTLPLAGTTFSGVSISWTSSNDAIALNGNQAVITIPATNTTVTLTATLTLGSVTETKTFTFELEKPAIDVVDAPVAGVAYKLGLFHGNEQANVFFHGGVYSDAQPFYLGYTTDLASAVDVYLEAVDGVANGYRLYFMRGSEKVYIRMYPRDNDPTSGKGTMELTTTVPTEYYVYNSEYKTLIYTDSEGHEFYMGSSGTYKSISTSAISYITSATSYIMHLYGDGHAHNYTSVTTDPTCVAAGKTVYTCECGHSYEEEGAAATGVHTYVDGTCSVCGAAEGHVCEFVAGTPVAPTCTAVGYTPYTCTCGASENRDEVAATGHNYVEGICSACQGTDPNHYFVMTVEEALAAKAGTKVQITGTISGFYQTWNSQYNNVSPYLTDATGKQIIIFRTTVNVGIGDTVTVRGEITAYNEVNQLAQGNTLTIDATHEHSYTSTVVAPTCLASGYTEHLCAVCGDSYKDSEVAALGHTTNSGICDNCGQEITGVEKQPVTVSKTIAELITQYGWTSTTTKQSFNLDDKVSVKINGGSNTGKAYNGDHIRIYATDTPAGTITITVPEGYELVSVKFTTQTGTYAFLCLDGTTTDICNKTVSVSGNSVLFNSVKNGSDGKQVRLTGIEVVYVEK